MTEEELLKILDTKLVELATAMLDYYSCCDMHDGACRAGDPSPCCYNSIMGRDLCRFSFLGKCQHINCECKLWLCRTAIEASDPKCVEGLKLLEKFGYLYGLVRRPLTGEPYSGADKQKI